MIKRQLLVCAVLLVSGCSSASVRELTKAETDYTAAVAKRVDDNSAAVEQLILDLRTIDRQYAHEEREKTLTAIAEAKLLESMKAPWAAPSASLQTTQRAVILFHLYELLGQQRALFEAEQTERNARRQKITDSYQKLGTVLSSVITNEKIVLEYVNQPKGSQIAAVIDETLKESKALSAELATSSDARLQALATQTEKATDRVEKTKDAIQAALEALNNLKK
ncbi:MAG TPA: hypothetical protein VER96_04210 [Polyangiaceae bacterium]|nr:hypothetical protein [Polyangiaceae bacterium]